MKFAAGASVGVMATPIPWKLLDDVSIWTQNWPWIPSNEKGANSFVPVVSKMCPSGVPVKIRLVNGRPVRVLPVEDHPLGGGVTALAVAEVQMLYSPGRVSKPLRRAPDGGFIEIGWKEAVGILLDQLKKAKGKTAFVSGDENGSTNEVLSALAKAMGSGSVFLMPSEGQCAAKAAELMGISAQVGYDLENSDYVLAIGANMLESWGTVVRNRRIFRDGRAHSYSNAAKDVKPTADTVAFSYAGAVQNNTAAVAKTWLPIYPGTEGILALGIANMLIAKGRMANVSDFAAFKALVGKYTPAETAKLTGVDPKKLEAVVNDLLAAKAPLVVVGSEFSQGEGAAPIMAGLAVNALLGNINKRGGVAMLPVPAPVLAGAARRTELYKNDLAAFVGGKEVPQALVLHEANPVYALPNPEATTAFFKSVPFKVSFTTFMDETAALCDLVLPIPMGLESIDDLESPYGVGKRIYCITATAAEPQADVIGTANTLLYVAGQMGLDLGCKMYQDLLKIKALTYEKCSFEILAAGRPGVVEGTVDVSGFALRPDILGRALKGGAKGDSLGLSLYAKLSMGTAKTGIPPYNTKTIRASELEGASMFVMMNKATATKKGLVDGDKVALDSGAKKIPARLRVYEGVMNDTVAVCLGFGHTALDEFSRNKGANVMELLNASPEPDTGLTVWSRVGVNVIKA
jgi:anaerobic selenocysteine-containing dehydrogenase